MGRVEKTAFISYRRTNAPWALAIFKDLTHHGYDVFFDFEGLTSGYFETVILENIRARAHFLVLLTLSALDDWLRREIETALDSRRNIVPVMLEGFDFSKPPISSQLTGKLSTLKSYNALHVPVYYFSEAMARLPKKFLNVPLDVVLHPASSLALRAAGHHQALAHAAPEVEKRALEAVRWCERGSDALFKGDIDEALRDFDEAMRLKPDYADARLVRDRLRGT